MSVLENSTMFDMLSVPKLRVFVFFLVRGSSYLERESTTSHPAPTFPRPEFYVSVASL